VIVGKGAAFFSIILWIFIVTFSARYNFSFFLLYIFYSLVVLVLANTFTLLHNISFYLVATLPMISCSYADLTRPMDSIDKIYQVPYISSGVGCQQLSTSTLYISPQTVHCHLCSSARVMADIQALLSALDVFSRAPDRSSLESANTWLQDFQHSVIVFRLWTVATNTSDCDSIRPLS